jgi:hypothetical protein
MQQYFANRTFLSLSEIPNYKDPIHDNIFANERPDDSLRAKHLRINNCTFAKMGFKKSKFFQCDLSFCVFIDCYFKKTEIEQTKFLNCTFIRCNFDGAYISDCDFEYATFDDCYIPYKEMKKNLPIHKENLCFDLCKNLSIQCLKLGEVEDYKLYLFEERHAAERHSIKKMFHRSDSYYKKYNFYEGICGLASYLQSKVSHLCWGYGEKLGTLIRNMVCLIVLCAIPYYYHCDSIASENIDSFTSALYFSICSFLNISTADIQGTLIKGLWLTENIIGVIFVGLFVTALFRRINRR